MDFGVPSRLGFRAGRSKTAVFDGASPGPTQSSAKPRSVASLARALAELLKGKYVELILVVAALSAAASLRLTYLASPKFAIDYVFMDHPGPNGIPKWLGLPHDRAKLLIVLGTAVLASELVAILIDVWGWYRLRLITWHLQVRFSRRLLRSALRLPLWKIQGVKSGGVASLLREDARAPGDILFQLVVNLWRSTLQLAGTLAVLAAVDKGLLALALALLPVVWVSHRGVIARTEPVFRAARRARQEVDARVAEAISGIRTIRTYRRERSVLRQFVSGTHLMVRHMMRGWWRTTYIDSGWRLVIAAASAVMLFYGGSRVLDGRLTLGDLLMFLGYIASLLRPLQQLVSGSLRLQDDFAGFSRALDVAEETPDSQDAGTKTLDRATVKGRIELAGVHYAYPDGGDEVLTGLDLTLNPGETVVLVGARGAGKTTAVNLVARLARPTAGRVSLDGTGVDELSTSSYREIVALVDQDVLLFDGTVRDNIAFGKEGASNRDIERAAGQANAVGFIAELKDGLDTVVGERGARLSGGQRQSIALARAFLREPKVLVLDEATNHLDGESEAVVLESIRALGPTCSRLLVTHRLSTIRAADRVLLMEDGRIVEDGTHPELLSRSPRYGQFLHNQLLAAETRSQLGAQDI